MYKALITDIDGTAVTISSNGDDVDEATRHAVSRAIAANKKITCATGRTWGIAKPVITKLGLTSPCIIEGGTRIVDPTSGKTLWEKSLDKYVPDKILKTFKALSTTGVIMHSSDLDGQPLDGVHALPEELRFVYLLAIPEEIAVKIGNQINTTAYAAAHFTPSWSGNGLVDIHVTHPQATKEHAIVTWQQLEGVAKAETIGLGDSGNDIPIFQSSGLKIAVGNATASLKQLADYIAPATDEHALEHVINGFLMKK